MAEKKKPGRDGEEKPMAVGDSPPEVILLKERIEHLEAKVEKHLRYHFGTVRGKQT